MSDQCSRQELAQISDRISANVVARMAKALGGSSVGPFGGGDIVAFDCTGNSFTCGDYTCTGTVGCSGEFGCTIKFSG